MNKALARALVVVTITATSAGCHESITTPTSPTAHRPLAPPVVSTDPAYHVADVTLSGYVFEMTSSGRQPIEGVDVLNGEGNWDTTDADGFYSVGPVWVCPCSAQPWIPAHTTFVWAAKAGYANPPGAPASTFGSAAGPTGARDVVIDGDTRVDIELVRK